MTEDPSASPTCAPDAPTLLGAIENLRSASRQLGAARRMATDEYARLSSTIDADRRAILDGWRASLAALEQVLRSVEDSIGRSQDVLYGAARHLAGLSPKPRPE